MIEPGGLKLERGRLKSSLLKMKIQARFLNDLVSNDRLLSGTPMAISTSTQLCEYLFLRSRRSRVLELVYSLLLDFASFPYHFFLCFQLPSNIIVYCFV